MRRRCMKGKEIRISKEVLPSLPEGYMETRLGDLRGARRQFRNSSGVHAREYEGEYTVHVDRADPRTDPIGHLVRDSPETLLSAAAGLLVGGSAVSRRRLPQQTRVAGYSSGVLTFLIVFLATNRLAKLLKEIFDWL